MILSTSLAAASFTQADSKSCSLPVSAATSTAGAGGGVLQPVSANSIKIVNPVFAIKDLIPTSDQESKGLPDDDLGEPGVARGIIRPDDDQVLARREVVDVNQESLARRIGHAVGCLDRQPRTGVHGIFAA